MYIFLIIIDIIALILIFFKFKKEIENYKIIIKNQLQQNYIKENKIIYESRIRHDLEELYAKKQEAERTIQERQSQLSTISIELASLESILRTQRESAQAFEQQLKESALKNAKEYEAILLSEAQREVNEKSKEMYTTAMASHAEMMEQIEAQAQEARAYLEQLLHEISEYSAKQEAINEAIMRQREIEEQKDFYRICLDDEAKGDISFLLDAKKNLKKTEFIDKIIYDNYVSKPVLEMIKRVLQNESFSGIYKITNLITNEIYIGKSSDIRNRWQQHCKTVFNCGTIASSILHINMRKYGIENFSFEVVERVSKDQLGAREKFYIDFYKSKEFGLNERKGG